MKGIIRIHNLDSKENPFAVDFSGHNEGSGSPCSNEEEVKRIVASLLKQHSNYQLEIIDERKKEAQMTLC